MDFICIHGGRQAAWVWEDAVAALRTLAGDRPGLLNITCTPAPGRATRL
jgi:hypothetical protein